MESVPAFVGRNDFVASIQVPFPQYGIGEITLMNKEKTR
jgi:hypothetical protein